MFISEIYQSRQGEGLLTGTPSVFVRTSGCNLRCGFCDTPFASWNPEGETLSIAEVVNRVVTAARATDSDLKTRDPADARHVVITGGEPMLPNEIEALCGQLKELGFHITIETAGTIHRDLACDLMSISPKLSNSDPDPRRAGKWLERHQKTRRQPDSIRKLIDQFNYQQKFVVNDPVDMVEIEAFLALIKPLDLARVLLMPQGIQQEELAERESWLEPICQARGYQLCRRWHILWYGNKRGT